MRTAQKAGRDGVVVIVALAVVAVISAFVDLNPEQQAALTGLASVLGLVSFRVGRDRSQGQPR